MAILFMIEPLMSNFTKILNLFNITAAIAITGAIRGTSSEKPFQELGLESLKLRI